MNVAATHRYTVRTNDCRYEIGSHSGKNVPTVTYFPPLTPLYHHLFGNIDARNVEFHERHHNKLHQNYGITQWVDLVVGTHKLQSQDAIENEGGIGTDCGDISRNSRQPASRLQDVCST